MSYINVQNICKQYIIKEKNSNSRSFLFRHIRQEKKVITAVDNISFELGKGEIVGYIGPNGAGKSTTIKMLTGILEPTFGTIEIEGIKPYENRRKYVKNIGVVFGQKSQLWWDLPVRDSFGLLKDIYKIPDVNYKRNIDMFDSVLQLGTLMDKQVKQLSLGQRMKCEIAACIIHDPKLIYLDEPTIGLDIIAKEKIRDIIRKINEEKNTTIVLTTHDMSDVEELCERIIIIDKGKKLYDGNTNAIKSLYGNNKIVTVEYESDVSMNLRNIEMLEDEEKGKSLAFQVTAYQQRNCWRISYLLERLSMLRFVKSLLKT